MSSLNALDMNLLKALNALLEEGNVTRAAERLALTQPAVSGMLARLRHYFDDPLFVRVGFNMQPTPRAEALKSPLKRILTELESLVQPTELNLAELAITLKIGATDNAIRAIGLPFITRLQQLAPKVKVAFLALQNRDMEMMLEKGELDFALMAHLAVPEKLRAKPLYQENYVCAMRQNHPILQQEWNVENFCAYDFVLGSFYGGGFYGATDRALAELGHQRNVALSVQNFALIPDLLRQSDWLAVVPEHLIFPSDDLTVKTLPFEAECYTKTLVWHDRTHFDKVQSWVRNVLVDVVGDLQKDGENNRLPIYSPTTAF